MKARYLDWTLDGKAPFPTERGRSLQDHVGSTLHVASATASRTRTATRAHKREHGGDFRSTTTETGVAITHVA